MWRVHTSYKAVLLNSVWYRPFQAHLAGDDEHFQTHVQTCGHRFRVVRGCFLLSQYSFWRDDQKPTAILFTSHPENK